MGDSGATLGKRAAARAAREPAFATVLEAILEAPTTGAGELTHVGARRVSDARGQQALDEFRAGSLTTSQVQQALGRSSAQAVHVLRSRGKLLGRTIGNHTWYPAWQLADGQLRADLAEVLDAIGRFTTDAVAADRIMRLRRDELGGKSIAAALDDPQWAASARNLLGALGLGQ